MRRKKERKNLQIIATSVFFGVRGAESGEKGTVLKKEKRKKNENNNPCS